MRVRATTLRAALLCAASVGAVLGALSAPLPATAQSAAAADMPAKAQACAACHGNGGNSSDPAVPSIAGQPKQFLVTQLYQFREGNRKDPQMSPMAANLSNADLNALAAYFSAQKLVRTGQPLAAARADAGRRVAEQNNCTQCHGATLLGQQHIPRLAGQHARYLRVQLTGFKATTRFDMDGQMTSASQALSPADIDLLADYLAGVGDP